MSFTRRTTCTGVAVVAAAAASALLPMGGAFAQTPAPPAADPVPDTPRTPVVPEPINQGRSRLLIGPELGTYLLTDSKARDAFGQSFFNYGIGLGLIPTANRAGLLNFEASVIAARRSGSSAIIAPVGAVYRVGLGNEYASTRPYVGVSANLFITDLQSDKYNVGSSVRVTGGASVLAGLSFSRRGYIQARYYGIAPTRGFNLSGANFTAGVRF